MMSRPARTRSRALCSIVALFALFAPSCIADLAHADSGYGCDDVVSPGIDHPQLEFLVDSMRYKPGRDNPPPPLDVKLSFPATVSMDIKFQKDDGPVGFLVRAAPQLKGTIANNADRPPVMPPDPATFLCKADPPEQGCRRWFKPVFVSFDMTRNCVNSKPMSYTITAPKIGPDGYVVGEWGICSYGSTTRPDSCENLIFNNQQNHEDSTYSKVNNAFGKLGDKGDRKHPLPKNH